MDKYFKPIASVRLLHDYYANKNLNAATLKPLPDTALFFKNHRMMFKKKGDHYVILQEALVETKEATITVEPFPRYLYFGINFNDTHYQLRSGLNFDPRTEKIVVETGEEENYLVSEKNIMPCWNALAISSDESMIITDKNNAVVFSSETDKKNEFDNLEPGVYKTNDRQFLKCSNCSEFEAVLIYELKETNEAQLKTITLPAGQYRWRYQVQKKYSQPEVLNLVDENEKVIFSQGNSIKEDLSVFLSDEAIPLSELSFTSLVLYNNDSIVKKFLPIPELENARFLSAEEKSLVLEAYVTI